MKTFTLLSAAVLATSMAASAQAALITYSSLSNFQAAAGATTLETFSSAKLGVSNANYLGSFNGFTLSTVANGDLSGIATGRVSSVSDTRPIPATFSSQQFFGWGNAPSGTGNGGTAPTVTFTFATGVSAFGFDWFNTDTTDNYAVIINNQQRFLIPTASSSAAATGFLGIVATNGDTFTSVTIQTRTAGGSITTAGLDNVRVSAPKAVPEPASLALLGIGLLGMASRRRRSRAA